MRPNSNRLSKLLSSSQSTRLARTKLRWSWSRSHSTSCHSYWTPTLTCPSRLKKSAKYTISAAANNWSKYSLTRANWILSRWRCCNNWRQFFPQSNSTRSCSHKCKRYLSSPHSSPSPPNPSNCPSPRRSKNSCQKRPTFMGRIISRRRRAVLRRMITKRRETE